jgi:helicase
MRVTDIKALLPERLFDILSQQYDELRPCQKKAIDKGLLTGANLLVCTPTASGKTLVAEMAALKAILDAEGKALYIVPLKALASEKFKDFGKRYGSLCKVALSIGDMDSADTYLEDYQLIICTSEKLDSLLRHRSPWLSRVAVVIVDEVHLLNDAGRGPTLEILLTIMRHLLPKMQLIALSATIGNPHELAKWLNANLVLDSWRPVELHQGVYHMGKTEFY